MVTLDRIRLTGLLTKKPRERGFFNSESVELRLELLLVLVLVT